MSSVVHVDNCPPLTPVCQCHANPAEYSHSEVGMFQMVIFPAIAIAIITTIL
jgi:hypothetical protein